MRISMKIGVFLEIFAILANVDFNLKKLSPSPPPPPWFPPKPSSILNQAYCIAYSIAYPLGPGPVAHI